MERRVMEDLVRWKSSDHRKPLILRGARQVGKTWLMKAFGEKHFESTAYINFENNERMQNIFNGSMEIDRLIMALQIESGVQIDLHKTLVIFDEIQEVPKALTSLKYFNEKAPELAIVAAGSLLGVAMHPGTSFPVGKVDFLELFPLDFIEFLKAIGDISLVQLLSQEDFELISSFSDKFTERLKSYFYVGGMPEAVAHYSKNGNLELVRIIQNNLLSAYEQDFSKHAPNETVPRLRMLWQSIPSQLARENRKFIYGLIRHGARAREYELALMWLKDCGLIHKVERITKPSLPLSAYHDTSAFKLYVLDLGLLGAMSGLEATKILEGDQLFEEFKGALSEQFVLQQLVSMHGLTPYYWSSETSKGEIDFLFQHGSKIIPVEVKAAENLQAKSLKTFCAKYEIRDAVRISLSDYRRESWMFNLPHYAISTLLSVVDQGEEIQVK